MTNETEFNIYWFTLIDEETKEVEKNKACPKCAGTGWNQATICAACCKHDQGWWELTEDYYGYEKGEDNRCCLAGCGTMYRDLVK